MLVTGYSILRDHYGRLAVGLDIIILVSSAWITVLSLADPAYTKVLTIGQFTPAELIGLAAVLIFILSIFQLRVNWKQLSDRYAQAARAYTSAKHLLRQALNEDANEGAGLENAIRFYSQISGEHIPIPERKFNALKRRHLIKVFVSKELSVNPGANIFLIKFRYWINSNFRELFK
jgi:hypothetical protein